MRRFILSVFFGMLSLSVVYVVVPPTYVMAEEFNIDVDRSSAWFDEGNRIFGAAVSVNGGAYVSTTYRLVSQGGDIDRVYQRKGSESNPWVYLGTVGPGKHDRYLPSEKSYRIFISVANVCAQSRGYDHMF